MKRLLAIVTLWVGAPTASATHIFTFLDAALPGLSAEAEFNLINPTTLEIRLRNTSTGVPGGFSNSDQILTGLSWDFGAAGEDPGDVVIIGGNVIIGPTSASLNFSTGSYGSGSDVSGEYGYGNGGGSGALTNFVSGNGAQATDFGGANLDGTSSLDGPQGGLVANPVAVALGGLGAIQDEIIASITLSRAMSQSEVNQDLKRNGVRVEFGSDAGFITVPEPSAAVMLVMLGGLTVLKRRRATALQTD